MKHERKYFFHERNERLRYGWYNQLRLYPLNSRMAENNEEFIQKAFFKLTENYIQHGAVINDLKSITITTTRKSAKNRSFTSRSKKLLVMLLMPFLYGIFNRYFYTNIIKSFQGTRCLLPNNYLVWEFTRPIMNCDYCRDVEEPLILPNLTKEEFWFYSYSSRPMIIKNAAYDWPARKEFTLEFFRNLYERIEGAYESVEEECQFLHFKSNLANLREVFAMSENRALHREGEDPWYVGWKNCHPQILDAMTQFYNVPHFLPDDAEIPYSNYIFMGYEEGAVMHVSFVVEWLSTCGIATVCHQYLQITFLIPFCSWIIYRDLCGKLK